MKDKFVKNVLETLLQYCEKEEFKGWDPYDGLNSKIFRKLNLNCFSFFRLAWIQLFKRNPINLRNLFLISKGYNSKGLGLMISGYSKLLLARKEKPELLEEIDKLENKINNLCEILISMKSRGYSGACWGYNFDWQSRRLFLFPAQTPTVVVTSFCVEALFKAYEITKNKNYKNLALSSAQFVLNDLKRTNHNSGFIFSYSPINGNNTVFNASLLGSKILSLCYKYSSNDIFKKTARKSIMAICESQQKNGAWIYGLLKTQSWIDSFHTGYNLEAIQIYQEITGDMSFDKYILKGFDFYINNFFESSGKPKYFHNKVYPIDIHCPAQLFVTLSKCNKFKHHSELARKVISWSINNMQSKKGYFYYQIRKGISSKISYMRWSNAFMFNAMTFYSKEIQKNEL